MSSSREAAGVINRGAAKRGTVYDARCLMRLHGSSMGFSGGLTTLVRGRCKSSQLQRIHCALRARRKRTGSLVVERQTAWRKQRSPAPCGVGLVLQLEECYSQQMRGLRCRRAYSTTSCSASSSAKRCSTVKPSVDGITNCRPRGSRASLAF